MGLTAFLAMVRKDLLLFFSDRRAVIVAFAVPIFIGSFIGSITGGAGRNAEPPRISVALVDEDNSTISKAIVAGAQGDKNLAVTVTTAEDAKGLVRKGTTSVGVIIPAKFGEESGRAMFQRRTKPELAVFFDPSRTAEVAMVRGILTEHIIQAVSREMFGGETGRRLVDDTLSSLDSSGLPDQQRRVLRDLMTSVQKLNSDRALSQAPGDGGAFSMPYTVKEEAMTSRENVPYNSFAHAFAGMGIQFLLFSALNLGIEMLVEREKGLWARLRSAPVSRYLIIGGKIASITIISLMTLLVSFGFAMLFFKVRIEGSYVGFATVAVACSMMAAGFGLLVAAVGNSPKTARGVSTLATLVMVMLGGAWVPTFVFPKWLQQVTVIVPVRWAVDGLDATTWRGLGLSSAVAPTLALLGFAAVFTAVALARFKWEEA